jgi:hypothetical protein
VNLGKRSGKNPEIFIRKSGNQEKAEGPSGIWDRLRVIAASLPSLFTVGGQISLPSRLPDFLIS